MSQKNNEIVYNECLKIMNKPIFSSPEPKAEGELLWLVFVRRPSLCKLFL